MRERKCVCVRESESDRCIETKKDREREDAAALPTTASPVLLLLLLLPFVATPVLLLVLLFHFPVKFREALGTVAAASSRSSRCCQSRLDLAIAVANSVRNSNKNLALLVDLQI